MIFVGFDLHKRYITACALDAGGQILAEVRQLSTSLEAVTTWLATLPGPVTIGAEATLYWEWLSGKLTEAGYTVRIAHAFHVKLIWQARAKTDPIDARKLAELLRIECFPAIWIPDVETRRRRQLLRGRAFLVRERTRIKNRIHGHLMTENLVSPGADLYGKGGRAWLATAPLSPVLRTQTHHLLTLHDALTDEIDALDQDVKRAAKQNATVTQLRTLPGVGVFSALMLHSEIGTIDRFRSSHQLAAYAGLVPTTRSSGGKTAHGGLGTASNRWLKWILIEIVVTMKMAPGPRRELLSPSPAREGEAESPSGGSPQTVLLSVLDVEERLDLRTVVAATSVSTVGGAPGATHGCGGVAGSRHSPGNANGPSPSNTGSCLLQT